MSAESLPVPDHACGAVLSRPEEAERLARALVHNLGVAASLRATAWQLSEAALRTFHPQLTEAEVQAQVRAQFRRTAG